MGRKVKMFLEGSDDTSMMMQTVGDSATRVVLCVYFWWRIDHQLVFQGCAHPGYFSPVARECVLLQYHTSRDSLPNRI